jgi:hypothetical protein
MPTSEDLPEDLWPLARRNAIELSDTRWETDVDRLIRAIEVICGDSPRTHPAAPLPDQPPEPSHDPAGDAGHVLDPIQPAIAGAATQSGDSTPAVHERREEKPSAFRPVWITYLAAAAVIVLAVTVASRLFSNGADNRVTQPPRLPSAGDRYASGTPAGHPVDAAPVVPPQTETAPLTTRGGTQPTGRTSGPIRGAATRGGTSGGGATTTDPEPGATSAGPTLRNTAPGATDSRPTTTDFRQPTSDSRTAATDSRPTTNDSRTATADPPRDAMPGETQTDSTQDAKAAIQQLLDQYVAAYRAMNEPRLKAIDPSFRGIQRRELMKSVSLTLGQPQIDVMPGGQSATLRASGNFTYVWNRAGLPSTSAAQLRWTLQKQGTTWAVVSSN